MATYYRWNRSSVELYESASYESYPSLSFSGVYWYANGKINPSGTIYTLPNSAQMPAAQRSVNTNGMSISPTQTTTVLYVGQTGSTLTGSGLTGGFTKYQMAQRKGTFIGYVYSTNPSTYPDGGILGSYYYDQRTEIGDLVLSVPLLMMQGQQATIKWTAIDGADSYTLQRKSSADADWTQVYSGTALTFSETVGTWTSLQYRVQAVFGDTPGGWATSGEIQIVSASALVISGSDGDLGTLTNDVQYSVSSDGSNALTVTESVNGTEIRTFTATNGGTNTISVVDLPTGYGTITITATTTATGGAVSVTRNWTYNKSAPAFGDTGSLSDLVKQAQTIWAKTIAEAVRTPGIWGGNLGLALQQLTKSVLYNQTQQAKYQEVTVNLANVAVGDEVPLPYNGVMVPHIVVHIGNPDAELYDASCDGVWLRRKISPQGGQWNSSGVTTLPNSTIMQTMDGYLSNYDETVQAEIKTVKIPYCVGNGSADVNSGANGYSCKIFPLSAKEVGFTDVVVSIEDGAKLDYYLSGQNNQSPANQRRIVYNNINNAVPQFTRTPVTNPAQNIYGISFDGSPGGGACTDSLAYVPVFIMPDTFTATYYVDNQGNVHDAQEYEEAGSFVDILGNDIPVPQIEIGSYVGTGTYAGNNYNQLTFSGRPMVVFVQKELDSQDYQAYMINGSRLCVVDPTASRTCNVTWEGNSVKWISSYSAQIQLNTSGTKYVYKALTLSGDDAS